MLTTIIGLISTAFLGVFGWAFMRTEDHEKRITTLESNALGLKEYIAVRFDSLEQRLGRIETSMDRETS